MLCGRHWKDVFAPQFSLPHLPQCPKSWPALLQNDYLGLASQSHSKRTSLIWGGGARCSVLLSPLFWYIPDAPAAPFLRIGCKRESTVFFLLFGLIVLCPWGRGRVANSLEGGQIIPFCNQPQLLKKTYTVFSFNRENMFCIALLCNHETHLGWLSFKISSRSHLG